MYDFGGPNDKGTYLDHGMCEWWGKDGRPTDRVTKMSFHQKFRWDLTNGSRSVSCDPAIRYSGFFGVRSVGNLGNFLEISNIREVSPSLRRMGIYVQISHIFCSSLCFFYGCTKKCRRIVFQKLQTDIAWGMLQKRSQDFRSFFLRTVGPAPKGPPEGIGSTIIYSNGGESPGRISYIDPTGKAKPEPNFQKKNSLCEVAFAPEVFYGDFGEEFVFFFRALRKGKHLSSRKHWGFWQYNSL